MHKIYLRILMPICAFFYPPHMHNIEKQPLLVILVPVRALSGTRFLSVRGLAENEYLILRIKEGHT